MQFDKDAVVNLIRQQAGSQQADQAAQQLPNKVDPEQHSDLLSKFGVSPQELVKNLGGLL